MLIPKYTLDASCDFPTEQEFQDLLHQFQSIQDKSIATIRRRLSLCPTKDGIQELIKLLHELLDHSIYSQFLDLLEVILLDRLENKGVQIGELIASQTNNYNN